MPEIDFYINDKEREELFDFLKESEIALVPEKKYSSPNFDVLESCEEFMETIKYETVGFIAISKHFSIYTLFLKKNPYFKNEEAFFIMPKYGGPYFEIGLYRGFGEEAPVKYKCTSLAYYSKYIKLQEQYEEFRATDELKVYFEKVLKFLRSKCRKVNVNGKNYWVSREVCEELGIH